MEKAKRARKAETPKQPSLCLRLRAPYLYPDHKVSACSSGNQGRNRGVFGHKLCGLKTVARDCP
jgi:hypothetical protein